MARFESREGDRATLASWFALVAGFVAAAIALALNMLALTRPLIDAMPLWMFSVLMVVPMAAAGAAAVTALWVVRGRGAVGWVALGSTLASATTPFLALLMHVPKARAVLAAEQSVGEPPSPPELPTNAAFSPVLFGTDGSRHDGGGAFVIDVDGQAVVVTAFTLLRGVFGWDPVVEPEDIRTRVLGVRATHGPRTVGTTWLPLDDINPLDVMLDFSTFGDVLAYLADDGGRSRLRVADAPAVAGDWVWIVSPNGAPVAARVVEFETYAVHYRLTTDDEPATGLPVVDASGAVVAIHMSVDADRGRGNPVGRFMAKLTQQARRAARRAAVAPSPVDDELLCAMEVHSACRSMALADDELDADGLRAALTAQCEEAYFAPSCQDIVWLDAGRALPRPEAEHPAACRAGDALSCLVHLEAAEYGDVAALAVAAEGCAVGVAAACAWLDGRVRTAEDGAAVGADARIALEAACHSKNAPSCGALASLFVADGDHARALDVARYACGADLGWACVRLGYVLTPDLGAGHNDW